MKQIIRSLVLATAPLLFSLGAHAIEVEDKAEIITGVINALAPKKEGDVTVTGAVQQKSHILINMEIDNPGLKEITAEEFAKIKPVIQTALTKSMCAEDFQRDFIASGGSIGYKLEVIDTKNTMEVKVDTCEDVDSKSQS